jgi:RNA polymerase sigma factor (sigma-70 family)
MGQSLQPACDGPFGPEFDKFYLDNHERALRRVRRRWLHDWTDAEEVLSQAWVAIVKLGGRFDAGSPAAVPYFFAVVRNVACSILRRRSHERALSLDAMPECVPSRDDPQVDALMRGVRRDVEEAVLDLSERQAFVWLGNRVEGLPLRALAKAEGISLRQARYARREADRTLRRRLRCHGPRRRGPR